MDFSNATYTKPMKVVFALPASCATGEAAFVTTAPDGQNIFGCTATNQWTLQSGAGLPSGMAGGKLAGTYPYPDLSGNRTTATTIAITTSAGTCASSIMPSTLHGAASISRISGSDSGLFTIACTSSATLACFYDSGVQIGNYTVSGFEGGTCTGATPSQNIGVVATVAIMNGFFSAGASDFRADTVVPMTPTAGAGLVSILNGVAVDTSLIPQMFFGISTPGSVAGNLPGNWYTDTAAKVLYECQKPSGTQAPACSGVGIGDWTAIPEKMTQTFYASGNGTVNAAGLVSYLMPIGAYAENEPILANAQAPVPKAGVISNLCAYYVGPTTAADQPLTISLNVNGIDDTSMVATMLESSPTKTKFCTVAGHTRMVLASDLITFAAKYLGATGPITSIRNLYWDIQ